MKPKIKEGESINHIVQVSNAPDSSRVGARVATETLPDGSIDYKVKVFGPCGREAIFYCTDKGAAERLAAAMSGVVDYAFFQ
ncbi:MAG: hypothetical protein WC423_24845 [Vulcanimicrobiota bacterium]